MLSKSIIKKTAFVTLIFFACLIFNDHVAFTQSEDVFAAVKRLLQQGDYDTAVSMLNQFIEKTQDVKGQEKNLAKGHYLLAKLYFIVSEADKKIDENIRKAFEIYPGFKQDEENMFFKERVEKIRNKLLEERKIEEPMEIEVKTEPEKVEKEKKKEEEKVIVKTTEKPKKKKKKFPVLLVVGGIAVVTALIFLLKKKKKNYTLTVNMSEGITGSPGAGSFSYNEGETVNYSYSISTGYTNIEVRLDGSPVSNSGIITMDKNHTLDVSASRLGTITNVTVRFTITFAGENLETIHKVSVDDVEKINQEFKFRQHYNENHIWQEFQHITKTFTINKPIGNFTIRHEVGPSWEKCYNNEGTWNGSPNYELEITNYQYQNGIDPGMPGLSEDSFELLVSPWRTDPNHEWYRIKTKTITINPPSLSQKTSSKTKTILSKDKPEAPALKK